MPARSYLTKTGQMRRMISTTDTTTRPKLLGAGDKQALYGYTFMYWVTKDKAFLDFAEKSPLLYLRQSSHAR